MNERLIFVCQNVDCRMREGNAVMERLQAATAGDGAVQVKPHLCFGACQQGPNVVVYPDKVWFAKVGVKVEKVLDYVRGGALPESLDTVNSELQELTYQLLDAGIY